MSKPILDPEFWNRRLQSSHRDERHHAVYPCPPEEWEKIEQRHRKILAKHISPEDDVLDAGCGWGRLVDLLPGPRSGFYLGVDLSPDFIDLARLERADKDNTFIVGELREVLKSLPVDRFHWAVCVSMRKMISTNLGEEVWGEIEEELMRVAQQVLILEYSDDAYARGFVLTREGSEI